MGRAPTFDRDEILDAAAALVARAGPAALTASAVARSVNAPSGSVYHRFRSRDVLAAELWLRTVERFQDGLAEAIAGDDPLEDARAAARFVLSWTRANPAEAAVLLLHHSRDLLDDGWPEDLVARNSAQRQRVAGLLRRLGDRLGVRDRHDRRRVRFAVVDLPYAAVREPLTRGTAPPVDLDDVVDDALLAVLGPLLRRT